MSSPVRSALATVVVMLALGCGLALGPSPAAGQRATLQPGSAEFEALARQVAQLDAQRYAIWRDHLDRPFDDHARARLDALGQQRRALEQRYLDAAGAEASRYQFFDRSRQLVAADVGPWWNRLMLERFPTPERLRADHPDDLRYYAALLTIGYEFSLGRTIRPPRTPELEARDAAYSAAMQAIEAKLKPPAENLRATQRFEQELHALTRSAAFKRETLGRYIPLFATFVPDDPPAPTAPPSAAPPALVEFLLRPVWQRDDDPANDIPLAVPLLAAVCVLAVLGPTWWVRRAVWRSGRRDNARSAAAGGAGSDRPALALPPELRFPELPGRMRPELALELGHIVDSNTWSETRISTSTSAGNAYQPAHTTVHAHSVQKDRMWLRTFDGRERAWTSTGGVFVARAGHLVAMVQARTRRGDENLAIAYNHTSGALYERDWIGEAHAHTLVIWVQALLFWVAPLTAAAVACAGTLADGTGTNVVPFMLSGAGQLSVFLLLWTLAVRWWVVRQRRSAWRRNYRPRVLELLQRFGREIEKIENAPGATP